MKRNVLEQAADYNKQRRKKVRRYKVLSVLAAFVVFCTTYSLIMPAITMEHPQCGLEEHTHGTGCYEEKLVCTLEESEGSGHVHSDDCYTVTTEKELTCGQSEGGHTHSDSCYTVETVTKYKTVTEDITETVTVEDTATRDVTDEEGNVIGSETYVTGSHEETKVIGTREVQVEDGAEEVRTLTCSESEGGHTHDDSCYTEVEHRELTCSESESGHHHTGDCYEKVLVCEIPEHHHDDSCYPAKDEGDKSDSSSDSSSADASEPETPDVEYETDEDGNLVLDEEGNPIPKKPAAIGDENKDLSNGILSDLLDKINAGLTDEEGYLIDENGERVLDENGEPVKVQRTGVALLPDGAAVPAGYNVEYNCENEDSGVAVTVYATKDAFPADYYGEDLEKLELVAEVLDESSTEYENAASALDSESFDGMVAMDIRFEIDGVEVEPMDRVYVVINAQGVLPENADPESVAIQHIEENAEAGIMTLDVEDEEPAASSDVNVVTVADVADETDGIVKVEGDADVAAAFEVDGFSFFTITYSNKAASVNFWLIDVDRMFDSSGKESGDIGSNEGKATDLGINDSTVDNSHINLESLIQSKGIQTVEWDGWIYEYVGAATDRDAYRNNKHVTDLYYYGGDWLSRGQGWYTESSHNNKVDTIHLFYKKTTKAPQKVYFYVLRDPDAGKFEYDKDFPAVPTGGSEGDTWFYMGKTTNDDLYVAGSHLGEKARWGSDPVHYPQLEPDNPYPTITVDGQQLTYSTDVTVPSSYHVEWIRYVAVQQAWIGQIGTAEETHKDSVPAWHVDGIVVKNDSYRTVSYELVNQAGTNATVKVGSTYVVKKDTVLTDAQKDSYAELLRQAGEGWTQPNNYNGTTWYTNRECTRPYDFDSPVTDNLTLYAPVVSDGTYNVYYYVLNPDALGNQEYKGFPVTWEGHTADQYWYYMGTARPEIENPGVYSYGHRFAYKEGPQVEPDNCHPNLTVGGKTYTYSEDPNATGKTYRIVWVRYVVANGYWKSGDDATGVPGTDPNRQNLDAGKQTWHVDGYIVLSDRAMVTYKMVDASNNNAEFDWLGIEAVEKGEHATGTTINIPQGYELVPGKEGKWYTDKACTQEYVLTANTVNADITLYTPVRVPPTTFDLNVEKVTPKDDSYRGTPSTAKDSDTWNALSGAKFEIQDATGGKVIAILNPNNTNNATATAKAEKLEIDVLYKLVETEAPAGYNALDHEIYFTVNADGTLTLQTVNGEGEKVEIPSNNTYVSGSINGDKDVLTLIVANYGGYVLPSTGGAGTLVYTLGGGMLMMVCALVLVYKKSLRKEGREF